MNHTKFFLLTVALLFMITAGELWAQTAAGWQAAAPEILASPQSRATQGRFHSTADDFIRPDSYTHADVYKWFAYTSWESHNGMAIGYATWLGSIYLGAYYGGNFWSGLEAFNSSTRYVAGWPSGARTVTVYDRLPELTYSANYNRLAVLIGVPDLDMGFRIQYGSTWQGFSDDNNFALATNEYYKNVSTGYGVISPQIEWSMTRTLLADGIQPYASLTLNFGRNNLRYNMQTGPEGEQVARSANYINPVFDAAMNGYTFYRKDNFEWTADFDYHLDFYLYSNDYSYLDSSGNTYRTKQISGLNNGSGSMSEDSYISNRFRPMLTGSWKEGPLGLKAKLNLPLTFTNSEQIPMRDRADGSGSLVTHGTYVYNSNFTFAPSLELGVQWKIAGDKLFLNAGGKIETSISRGTEKNINYQSGVKDDNSIVNKQTTTFGNTASHVSAGIAFYPAQNLSLEASCGVEGDNSIDVFKSGGLFNFSRILVSVRF